MESEDAVRSRHTEVCLSQTAFCVPIAPLLPPSALWDREARGDVIVSHRAGVEGPGLAASTVPL